MLIEVADVDVFGPFDFALIRLQMSGDDVHESGFSLAVGTDESDMFAF